MASKEELWEGAKVSFMSGGTDSTTGEVKYLNGGQAIVHPDGHSAAFTIMMSISSLQLLPPEEAITRSRKERFPYLGG